jgi:hypothetical protein
MTSHSLTVAPKRETVKERKQNIIICRFQIAENNARVVSPPGSAAGCLVVPVALAQPSVLLANRGETTRFAMLVYRSGDPVDFGVPTDLCQVTSQLAGTRLGGLAN